MQQKDGHVCLFNNSHLSFITLSIRRFKERQKKMYSKGETHILLKGINRNKNFENKQK
jgi:hypothetical protein